MTKKIQRQLKKRQKGMFSRMRARVMGGKQMQVNRARSLDGVWRRMWGRALIC